jgi:hypothetical protein
MRFVKPRMDIRPAGARDGGAMAAWILVAVLIAACAVGFWFLFRSFRRWKQPPPSDWAAASELWSVRNMNQA